MEGPVRSQILPKWQRVKHAVNIVLRGGSVPAAAQETRLSRRTVRKYYNNHLRSHFRNNPVPIGDIEALPNNKFHVIFTPEQEETLKEYFRQFQSQFYGLSDKECRMLAHQLAIKIGLQVPYYWVDRKVDSEWLQLFKIRHETFRVEHPYRCSSKITRSIVWEKKNVTDFFDNLELAIHSNPALQDGSRIFNLDETSITYYDADNDSIELLTCCCIVGVTGCLPPVAIIPHNDTGFARGLVSWRPLLTSRDGTLAENLFPDIMEHFISQTSSTKKNPSILIIDSNISHLSLAAFDAAKDAGVSIITVHPHVSKKLQPLETLYEMLLKEIASAQPWSADNIDNNLKGYETYKMEIIAKAFEETMTVENIKSAFEKHGILPFDRDLLTDNDYQACVIKDQICLDCRAREKRSTRNDLIKPDEIAQKEPVASSSVEVTSREKVEDLGGVSADATKSTSNESPHKIWKEMSVRQRSAELDKLKRRMIRTVSRLLKEKKSEDEVWEELKKEGGTNCKSLWERMRSLTMKKLKRLLDGNDRVDNVPAVARMTLTDWLLYDLIIVHEKIDVIDRCGESSVRMLNNLFSLVQMFGIEGRRGEDLAEAWAAATVYYNSKGHQCSPMLMQRRWYQIKELTRHKLYKFWFNYRGNQRLLVRAMEDAPSDLQRAIALRYPEIVTHPFPDWSERIEARLVIMPEEFEVKMRNKNLMKPTDDTVPDVEIVEQKIDTITLGDSDSDFCDDENSNDSNILPKMPQNSDSMNSQDDDLQTPIIVQVKTEPKDDCEEENAEGFYQPPSEIANERLQDEIDRLQMQEEKIETNECKKFAGGKIEHNSSVTVAEDSAKEKKTAQIDVTETVETIPIISDVEEENVTQTQFANDKSVETVPLISCVTGAVEEITSIQTEFANETDSANTVPLISNITGSVQETITQTDVVTKKETVEIENQDTLETILLDDDDDDVPLNVIQADKHLMDTANIDMAGPESMNEIKIEPDVDILDIEEPTIMDVTLPIITNVTSNLDILSNLDTVESETATRNVTQYNTIEHHLDDTVSYEARNSKVAGQSDRAQDVIHDLAQEIISEMNFAEDGIEFADDGIEYVDSETENEFKETEDIKETGGEGTPKFDLKLLMNPVVYTTKLDDMTVFKNRLIYDTVDNIELVDKIVLESKPISDKCIKINPEKVEDVIVKVETQDTDDLNDIDDDLFQNEFDSDESSVPDIKRVKLSSNCLQKPKSLSYNPIQLCKNPDFNTRLKRLSIGFFSYMQNRVYLKACKPMTIDLSKAFEQKLVEGTLYLKPSDATVDVAEKHEKHATETTSVLPSSVSVQSLMDSTEVDTILQQELKKRMYERNKTINLPHISVVRQINQQLLMAEVAPIMAQIEKSSTNNTENVALNVATEKVDEVLLDKEVKNAPPDFVLENTIQPTVSSDNLLIARSKSPANVQTLLSNPTEKSKKDDKSQQTKADKLKKLKESKTRNLFNVPPSWLSKANANAQNETLLTIDTLYKILHAIDPSKNLASKVCSKTKKPKLGSNVQKEAIGNLDKSSKNPEKENTQKKPVQVDNPSSRSKKKTCCWARAKIRKILRIHENPRIGVHRCVGICSCCCHEDLQRISLQTSAKKRGDKDNVSIAIETVINRSRNNVNRDPTEAAVDSIESIDITKEPDTVTDAVAVRLSADQHVTIDLDEDVANSTSTDAVYSDSNPTVESPRPKFRVYSSSSNTDNLHLSSIRSKLPDPKKNRPKVNFIRPSDCIPTAAQPAPKIRVKQFSSMVNEENVVLNKCSCQTSVRVDKSTAMLCVDGSNDCTLHTKTRAHKETKIFVKSKQPPTADRPFFVGKNKILLTNIRPAGSEPPCVEGPVPASQPAASSTDPVQFQVPEGVQVVLLTDGTISYVAEPNVQLTAEQVAAMPHILSLIQQEIKATGVTLPSLNDIPMQNVVSSINIDVNERQNTDNLQTLPYVKEIQQINLESQINANIIVSGSNCFSTTTTTTTTTTLPNEIVEMQKEDSISCASVTDQTKSQLPSSSNTELEQFINSADANSVVGQPNNEAPVNIVGAGLMVTEVDTQVLVTTVKETNVESTIESSNENKPNQETVVNETNVEPSTESSNENKTNQETVVNKTNVEPSTESCNENKPNQETVVNETNVEPSTERCNENKPNQETVVNETNVEPSTESCNENKPNQETFVNKKNVEPSTVNCNENRPNQETVVNETNVEPSKESCNKNKPNQETVVNETHVDPSTESCNENETNQEIVAPTDAPKTHRNLLSDLMEMSGILEDDIAAPPEPVVGDITSNVTPFPEPIAPQEPVNELSSLPVPALSPIGRKKDTISAQVDDKVYELYPISCFSELKYACECNGLFFKLDLLNGTIVPINVCIQKSTTEQKSTSNVVKNVSDVIDLTDETAAVEEQSSLTIPQHGDMSSFARKKPRRPRNTYNNKTGVYSTQKQKQLIIDESSQNTIQDIDATYVMNTRLRNPKSILSEEHETFKKHLQNTSSDATIESTNMSNTTEESQTQTNTKLIQRSDDRIALMQRRLSNNLKPLKMYQTNKLPPIILKKRTPVKTVPIVPKALSRIGVTINLDDSDAPMEEEYLDEFSADSDDEPLAKIAKKVHAIKNTDLNESSGMESQDSTTDGRVDFEEAIDALPNPSQPEPNDVNKMGPVPTQLVLSGGALNHPILLNQAFLPPDDVDEDSQDDCILGV